MLLGPVGGIASAVARLLARAGGAAARLLERLIPRPPFPAAPPPTPIPPAIEEAVGRLTPQERAEIGELARREITAEDFAARLNALGQDIVLNPEALPIGAKRFGRRAVAVFRYTFETPEGFEDFRFAGVGFDSPRLLSELEAEARRLFEEYTGRIPFGRIKAVDLVYVAKRAG